MQEKRASHSRGCSRARNNRKQIAYARRRLHPKRSQHALPNTQHLMLCNPYLHNPNNIDAVFLKNGAQGSATGP